MHHRPNVQVLGVVHLREQCTEILSSSIPLALNEYNTGAMMDLMHFMAAVKKLFDGLRAIYETPQSN